MKNLFKKIKELRKTPKGNAILFFGFYFVFFVIVILIIKFGNRIQVVHTDYERGSSYTFYMNGILNSNFIYDYKITLDGVTSEYVGQKYGNTELFSYQGREYYCNLDNYFMKDVLWFKSNSPYIFSEFLNINNINTIINSSTYESKTVYENGKNTYNFLVSSNTINDLLYNVSSDYEEVPNTIVVSTDENKNVNHIMFKLDSFCFVNSYCNSSLEIELVYDKFGEVEKINNPIE